MEVLEWYQPTASSLPRPRVYACWADSMSASIGEFVVIVTIV